MRQRAESECGIRCGFVCVTVEALKKIPAVMFLCWLGGWAAFAATNDYFLC